MTPAVTAIALIRFARVDRSTSTGIGYATEKKTDATRNVLNRINEWAIDFHFDWRWWRRSQSCPCHHRHGGFCSRLGSFFIHRGKKFLKDLRDIEVILLRSLRHFFENGPALWLVERRPHPARL